MSNEHIDVDLETGEEVVLPANNSSQGHEQDSELDQGGSKEGLRNDADQEDEDDEEHNPNHSEEEREAIRERRRIERRNRKVAAREREDTLRRELAARDSVINEMRAKLELIEQRHSGSELAQIETGKKQAAQSYNFFKDQIRVATEAGNGAAVADATEKMMQSQRRFDELDRVEQALKQRRSTPQPLDPRLANHAQNWMARNAWYDPSGRDQDSEIAMRLDQRMAQEGWDPTTPEYWEELDNRVKKYLPHRASSGKMERVKPRSVVSGSGRENSGASSGKTYRLSSDRVQALKDAGIWDDPKQRTEAIKRFREYDLQNPNN